MEMLVKRKYWLCFWLAAALLLFFGNGQLLITDSVESNYALTAKEMVLSGDYLSPQIYGHYWYDKPILFYLLTALSFKVFGFTEFAARLAPSLFGLAGLGLIAWGGSKLYNKRVGFYSAVMLLTSVEFFLISKSVITDAVLFLFFSATLLYFYLGYSKGKSLYWYLMYASAAVSVLTKGPIGVLLPGLIITIFLLSQRDWRVLLRMHLVSGTLLCFAIAAPWYVYMYAVHGDAFINTFFGTHNFLRATVSEHPRDDVFYYYTLVNILAVFPWSGLVPVVIYDCWQRGWKKIEAKEIFLVIWTVIVFLFFQSMATKYITYTYPLLFPLLLLLAHYLEQHEELIFNKFYLGFVAGFFLLLLGAVWYVDAYNIVADRNLFLVPLSLMLGLFLALYLRSRSVPAMVGVGVVCLAFYLSLISSIAVPFSQLRSGKELGLSLAQLPQSEVGLYGKYPTSAVFYSGKQIVKLIPESDVEGFVPKGYSWSSKNVMPYATLENEPYSVVVLEPKNINNFMQYANKDWRMLSVSGQWIIVKDRAS